MTRILALLILAFPAIACALVVKGVNVHCFGSSDCESQSASLRFLERSYSDIEHLKRTVSLYVLNEGIKSFQYRLVEDSEGELRLEVDLGVKQLLLSYSITVDKDPGLEMPTVLPLREGDYVDDKALKKTRELLEDVLKDQGFPDAKIGFRQDVKKDGVEVAIRLKLGRPVLLKGIKVRSDSPMLEGLAVQSLSRHKNKNFNLQKIRSSIEQLRQLYIDYGFYVNDINVSQDIEDKYSAFVDVVVKSNDLHVFTVEGNKSISDSEIKSTMKSTVLSYKRLLPPETVVQRVRSLYADRAFVDAEISVNMEKYKNKDGELVNRYNIGVIEGERATIERIRFNGNSALDGKRLKAIFYDNAPSVVKNGYFQRKYVDNFVEAIREQYIIRGYVNVLVEAPRVNITDGKAYVNYRVREGVKATVTHIRFKGIGPEKEADLRRILGNKEGESFNPVTFGKDLEMIERRLRQDGHYFAEIKNRNSNNIVNYKNDNSNVEINIEIDLGKRLITEQIIIIGNRQTRSKLIRRELALRKGDLVTREKIQQSQTNLLGLGIFSSVLIEPVPSEDGAADILVSVREKDFGVIELAPGIRTDLGIKLSTNITYNNLDGMNKRVSFKGQVNQRFNLDSLDERRREESSSLIEYDLAVNYSENSIFDSNVDFSASLGNSRQRFFSFDANIERLNFTFNRELTDWLDASLRPQFEDIEQFDATSEVDEGTFQIGSITPGLSADFRNNRINPTSGAWFNLSMEYAGPEFGSQQNINYNKIISRNRFYVPFSGGTLAMSATGGFERNLDKGPNSYIPNIKVFRLNGIDIVRGYHDDEINRLPSGEDISQVQVTDSAYMAVFRVEPRFFLSDSTMLGFFYDAGGVFVNNLDLDHLRDSVGITFKVLTPLGSLDFDYGIKLLRKTYPDGMVDSPGRFQVSIGFF